jgi:hypothetical protein
MISIYRLEAWSEATGVCLACGLTDGLVRVTCACAGDSLYRCKSLKRAALGRMCTIVRKLKASLGYLDEVRSWSFSRGGTAFVCGTELVGVHHSDLGLRREGGTAFVCGTESSGVHHERLSTTAVASPRGWHSTQIRKHLARLPSIDTDTRTLLVCGYPNVGKSSFMNKVSCGSGPAARARDEPCEESTGLSAVGERQPWLWAHL